MGGEEIRFFLCSANDWQRGLKVLEIEIIQMGKTRNRINLINGETRFGRTTYTAVTFPPKIVPRIS